MEEKVSTRLAIILLFILLIAVILLVPVTANSSTDGNAKQNSNIQTNKTLKVMIFNGAVSLLENDKPIKTYDIDITMLPGEDIKLLYEGIEVRSKSEADLIAEDFDG